MEELPRAREAALLNWDETFQGNSTWFSFTVQVHSVPLVIHASSLNICDELKNFFPQSWQVSEKDPIHIYWLEPSTAAKGSWDSIESPDCFFHGPFISQRDFLSKKVNNKCFQVMAAYQLDDGLFNFLRFLLPRELLQHNKILFHSSCVVSENKIPFLFFGPSNAGKTTIAGLCSESASVRVLGDDMNVLSLVDGQWLVEGAALTQRLFSPKNFSRQYPLKTAFWLEQAQSFDHVKMQQGRLKYLLSSFANLFWDQLDEGSYNKVFELLGHLNNQLDLYRLSFKKSPEVFPYVQSL